MFFRRCWKFHKMLENLVLNNPVLAGKKEELG